MKKKTKKIIKISKLKTFYFPLTKVKEDDIEKIVNTWAENNMIEWEEREIISFEDSILIIITYKDSYYVT